MEHIVAIDGGKTSPQHNRPQLKRAQLILNEYLNNTLFGVYWDLSQAVIAILSFCLYCAEMSATTTLPLWMVCIEAVLTFLFVVDYTLYFFASERKLGFAISLHSAIDILSILPVATLPALYNGSLGPSLQFLRILRLFRAYRLIEISTTGGPSDATILRQV
jgi:hypothetical protein